MSNKEFAGKYAVVTGATSGMGACSATLMAKAGLAGVVIIGRNEERAKAVVAECEQYGCKTWISLCDISKVEDIQNTIAYITESLPQVDILINAAGISPYNEPWNTESVEHFDFIIQNNLRSQFMFCQAMAKLMVARKYGKIVNYASCVARTGSGISLSYAASKGAIVSMTRSLAKVVGPDGVNVNAILPGVIDTPMCGGQDYSASAQTWPLRRMGKAEEVAEVAVFLASDKASYMAGASVDVNGGYVFG